jgi:hypothetical protein
MGMIAQQHTTSLDLDRDLLAQHIALPRVQELTIAIGRGAKKAQQAMIDSLKALQSMIQVPQHGFSLVYPGAQTLVAWGNSCCFLEGKQGFSVRELVTDELYRETEG